MSAAVTFRLKALATYLGCLIVFGGILMSGMSNLVAFLFAWTVILVPAAVYAAWTRIRFAWYPVAAIVLDFLVCAGFGVTQGFRPSASGWGAFTVIRAAAAVLALVPVKRPADAPEPQHVYHHHMVHGAVAPPVESVTATPVRKVISGNAVKAIRGPAAQARWGTTVRRASEEKVS